MQRFRLGHAQAYLYKPEQCTRKNVGASTAEALEHACTGFLTITVQKHICTGWDVGDSLTATRPLIRLQAHLYLYKPERQNSKSVRAPAAVARRESTASNPHSPPHTFDLVLHDECNANLGGHLGIVGREPGPQAQETASLELLGSTV